MCRILDLVQACIGGEVFFFIFWHFLMFSLMCEFLWPTAENFCVVNHCQVMNYFLFLKQKGYLKTIISPLSYEPPHNTGAHLKQHQCLGLLQPGPTATAQQQEQQQCLQTAFCNFTHWARMLSQLLESVLRVCSTKQMSYVKERGSFIFTVSFVCCYYGITICLQL